MGQIRDARDMRTENLSIACMTGCIALTIQWLRELLSRIQPTDRRHRRSPS